jgi:hypothetical protein
MGLTARVPSGADTAGFVPEVWSNKIIDAMKNVLVCWDAFDTDQWRSDLKKGDTINIGITNHVTATEVVVGTKASSLDIATGSKKQLTVAYWYEAPVDIDYMTIKQSQLDWAGQAQREAAYAIAKRMDTTINGLFSALNGSSVHGSDGQELTDDILLALFEKLNEADVPFEGRSLITDPSGITDILKVDKFIAAQYANNTGAVNNGIIGKSPIYSCTVRVTNNLTAATIGSYGVMAHKDAIMGVSQMEPAWTKDYPDLHLTRYSAEALYGVLEKRDDFGIPFYTRHA